MAHQKFAFPLLFSSLMLVAQPGSAQATAESANEKGIADEEVAEEAAHEEADDEGATNKGATNKGATNEESAAQEEPEAASVATDSATPQPGEAAPAKELPELPWHLVNVWWEFKDGPEFEDFQSLEIDVTLDRDLPKDVNLYIAPVGGSEFNHTMFYGGLQTNINGFLGPDDDEPKTLGRGGIFSRWSDDMNTPLTPAHLRRFADGLQETAGYEGEFASVRRPFAWGKGTYTFRLEKRERTTFAGKPALWVTASVRNHQLGITTEIGSLVFEGETLDLEPYICAFAEIYATAWIEKKEVVPVVITFGYPRINGKMPAPERLFVDFPNEGGEGATDSATARADGSDTVVTIGEFFDRDENQRTHPLDLKLPE